MLRQKGFHTVPLLLFLIGLVGVIGDEQKVCILCLDPYYLITLSLSLSLSLMAMIMKVVQKFYIVYLGDRPVDKDNATRTHVHLLSSVKGR